MTHLDRTPPDSIDQNVIEQDAASWLERKYFGTWSEADQLQLEEWLDASWARRVAFWRLETSWSRTERLTALRKPAAAQSDPEQSRAGYGKSIISAVALAAVVTGVLGYLAFPGSHEKRYATALGEHKIVQLADGSRIELNTSTLLRVSSDTVRRQVWLDQGEAYFDIRHSVTRPFTVLVSGHRITDLGTQFSVRNNADRIEVSLVGGRARIDALPSLQSKASAILVPGDVAIATADTLKIVKTSEQVLRNQLGWRRGMLVFVHATLADVAAEFNRYNSTKIVIADSAIARRRVGATLPAQDLADFTVLARSSLRLRVVQLGNKIVVSR
jgi:transmembrane sensor